MSSELIEASQAGEATVVRVACRQIIDQSVINGIYQQVAKLSELPSSRNLVVDLTDVEYMSGVTLNMFVLLEQAATTGGHRIGFCQLSSAVDELFRLSRFHKVLNVFPTKAEAIAGLTRMGHQQGHGQSSRNGRRSVNQSPAMQFVEVGEESEFSMSGIVPGLPMTASDSSDIEAKQFESDRAELIASDLPTFAEPELQFAGDLSEIELGDSAIGEDDTETVLVQTTSSLPPEAPETELIHEVITDATDEADLTSVSVPTAKSSTEAIPATQDVGESSPPLELALAGAARVEFLEADWAELFAAAESIEESDQPDFVVELWTDDAQAPTEKPRCVTVEPAPLRLPQSGSPVTQSLNSMAATDRSEIKTEMASTPDVKKPATALFRVPRPTRSAPPSSIIVTESVPVALDDQDAESIFSEDCGKTLPSDDRQFTVIPVGPGDSREFDQPRAKVVGQRHVQVAEFLRERKLDAVLLTRPSNFAWFTAGGLPTRDIGHEPSAALLITPRSRTVLCRNADMHQLLMHEITGLGFELLERMWFDDPQAALSRFLRDHDVAADVPLRRTTDLSGKISAMRLPLAISECQSLRNTGRIVSEVVEITAKKVRAGVTESEIAAQVLYRLAKCQVTPIRIQVQGDGRGQRNRQGDYSLAPIERFATISVIAQRKGLHVAVSRTVSIGPPPTELRDAHLATLQIQAAAMLPSRHRWDVSEAWGAIERYYEKLGRTNEWQSADMGCVTGYELCEAPIAPDASLELKQMMPVIWRSGIGPAFSMDTILVRGSIFKILTKMKDWPQFTVNVQGTLIARPDILVLAR